MRSEATQPISLTPIARADTEIAQRSSKSSGMRPFLQHLQEYGILVVFILAFVFFSSASRRFLIPDNLLNVTLPIFIIAIIVAGMTFIILITGNDLSVASLMTLTGVVAAWILKFTLPPVMGVCLAIAGGLLPGIFPCIIAGFNFTFSSHTVYCHSGVDNDLAWTG
ncbi:MAG: hypothetical protein ONB44_18425 [candidate division KSB1 bacterium]|nr:hypothetical protein [candidate division KSB1 bacterium]MDZ7304106.1 hypothetical protein [candidate division KSB1 bacterium]MDZ7313397.1 hypothetical protein [candidate division KSB1 bacterium]